MEMSQQISSISLRQTDRGRL